MNMQQTAERGYYSVDSCKLADLATLTARQTNPQDVPLAQDIARHIPIYGGAGLSDQLASATQRRSLMAEWADILQNGAGVFVIRQAQPDHGAIDDATAIYNQIIADEKAGNTGADHFAAAGSNDRVWNSLQKLCTTAPDTFIRYFAAPAIDAASEAWLGPNYQMTAQVNLVHPGGKAQQAHRDYHLGFQTGEVSALYPAHVHDLSPLMTLQGGLAHCDVPVESGPTKLLPFSQLYRPGYAAWRRDDFRAFFEDNYVQLPLEKGDALFFNPALFHAAGENRSKDIRRMVNLFQVSSAFGRSLENINRVTMCKALYTPLCAAWADQKMTGAQLDAVIGSTAEGYSFPTNLDTDPPVGGLAPKTQAQLLKQAVLDDMPAEAFFDLLEKQAKRKQV